MTPIQLIHIPSPGSLRGDYNWIKLFHLIITCKRIEY